MLKDGVMNGAFFETYVVSEVIKSFMNNGVDSTQYLYYYRDIDKKEVDILLVKDGVLYPVEIKKGVSPTKPTKNSPPATYSFCAAKANASCWNRPAKAKKAGCI